MNASLFSWPGLLISALVVVAILGLIFLVVRAVLRFVRRRVLAPGGVPPAPPASALSTDQEAGSSDSQAPGLP